MALRKRNEYIAADESEDEDGGYDSEQAEESKGRIAKRRKLDDSGSDSDESNNGQDDSFVTAPELEVAAQEEEEEEEDMKSGDIGSGRASPPKSIFEDLDQSTAKPLDEDSSAVKEKAKAKLKRKLAKSLKKTSQTGVVYISRVPPFMKPHTLKNLLASFAPSGLGRIFLTPEDSINHKSRVKSGGNKKRSFLDGWVEFVSKQEAEIAAETLNARPIGGKKGGYYRDDVWNLKFLNGFKWRHLTEEIANQNAERSARLRAEGARERREVRVFLANVEKGKMLDGMERKRKGRENKADDEGKEADVVEKSVVPKHRTSKSQFRQTEVLSKSIGKAGNDEQPEEVKRVLSKIF